ncbi:MAG TPA: ribulose-phosphate 3-epimerase [Eggerthellaceae bacterium]|nr:ribulose-phosphate 3-epimerase [Eggerthellaceae bacterium]
MFQPVKVAPSILSADFMNLQRDIRTIEEGGAGFVHVDVMDGHFVPNLTIGVPHVKQLKRITQLPLDVHLMIANPLEQLPWFIQAGADLITVHAETLEGQWLDRAVALIHEGGARACVACKPQTPVDVLAGVVGSLDMVLVMSVEPGFSGQGYIEGSEDKVARVVAMAREAGNDALLVEVDGGIGPATVERVCAAGADVVVCGNAVYAADDPKRAIADIAAAGDRARLAAIQAGALR